MLVCVGPAGIPVITEHRLTTDEGSGPLDELPVFPLS